MIWGIFMFPLLWLQETLSLANFSSNSKTFTNENQMLFTVGAFQKEMQ
jgi:hypothetical protein